MPKARTPPPEIDASATTSARARPWPSTRREDVTDTVHGVAVADPYRWLERGDDKDVQAWMAAQDGYARAELAKLGELAPMIELLRGVLYYDAMTEPVHRRGRFFYERRHTDRERPVVYWKRGERGAEHVLFDPNTWPATRALGDWWPSPDGKLVAYTVGEHNADEKTLRVFDVDAGTDRRDEIAGLKWVTPSWAPDGKGFYYRSLPAKGTVPETERRGRAELRFHPVGGDPTRDPVMFPATGDAKAHLDGFVSHDGHWLFATIDRGFTATDIHVRDLRKKRGRWRALVQGVDATFAVVPWRDRFYVRTNDGAARNRVMRVDPARLERAAWKELVPEDADATLQQMRLVGGRLALTYLRNASTEIAIHELDGRRVRTLALPPLGKCEGVSGAPDEDTGYLTYSSFTEPGIVSKTSMKTGAITELARVALPVDTRAYVTEQVWYPSKDGTKISMFIVRKRDVARTGRVPTILWGYGGFGEAITPAFQGSRVAWLEAGGVYAIPNLRGGGEYGDAWHRAGMAEHKQHAIDDLRAAGHYLIDSGWTSRAHLGLMGASNGGLVVTAAMTQEPDLARAVVAVVPLTDMVRYPRFGHASAWVSEYGSPDDPTQFAALHAYSPYHHVVAGTAYPALLVITSDHDDRVDPMHARKLLAAVQAATTRDAPVLLRIERGAGHRGPAAVREQIEKAAVMHAFLLAQLK